MLPAYDLDLDLSRSESLPEKLLPLAVEEVETIELVSCILTVSIISPWNHTASTRITARIRSHIFLARLLSRIYQSKWAGRHSS